MNRPKFLLYAFVFLALSSGIVLAGQTTMTTFYPSPTGYYNSLYANSIGIGTTSSSGNGGLEVLKTNANTAWQQWVDGGSNGSSNTTTAQLFDGSNDYPVFDLYTNSGGNGIELRTDGSPNYINTGNVGIGTITSAGGVLTVSNSNISNPVLGLFQVTGGTNAEVEIQTPITYWTFDVLGSGTGDLYEFSGNRPTANLILQPYGGNIGIGSTAPGSLLDVNGNAHFNGNVGIGIENPAVPLQVSSKINSWNLFSVTNGNNGDTYGAIFADGSSNAWLTLNDSTNTTQVRLSTTSGIPSFINEGNVGIDQNNPQAVLDVKGNSGAPDTLIGAVCGAGNIYGGISVQGAVSGCNGYSLLGDGTNLYINSGTTASAGAINFRTQNTTTLMSLDTSGNLTVTGNITASSDQRLKKDIQPIPHALEKVQRLDGVSFRWKKTGAKDIGVIAQDLEKVLPELVHTDKDGMKSVEYGNISAVLIEAIKDEQKEIKELQDKINALQEKVSILEKQK